MMVVRLSTKGQIVIPRDIRLALGLQPGTEFEVRVEGDMIIFEPIQHTSRINALWGKYRQHDLLAELETEHRRELQRENE